ANDPSSATFANIASPSKSGSLAISPHHFIYATLGCNQFYFEKIGPSIFFTHRSTQHRTSQYPLLLND
ncbi:hypothetical protein, partial [Paraburkholderia bannensis]|uniref:hypothetical protein n=1 Tax=Paraburkholderia bannensis TaxID=765414 RepID=UPI002AB7A46C